MKGFYLIYYSRLIFNSTDEFFQLMTFSTCLFDQFFIQAIKSLMSHCETEISFLLYRIFNNVIRHKCLISFAKLTVMSQLYLIQNLMVEFSTAYVIIIACVSGIMPTSQEKGFVVNNNFITRVDCGNILECCQFHGYG